MNEELEGGLVLGPIAKADGQGGAKIGAGALSAKGDPIRVAPQRPGIGQRPFKGIGAIVERRGKRMFGRETIAYGQHRALRPVRKDSARRIVAFDIAKHPAAPMKEDQEWRWNMLHAMRLV
ncbi:hypothetical protein GCM10019071_30590 [Sphingobium fuliginis]|uniref:Uncharacterized protein n=1 Tax=Sphingobium fuliginis (strain ATCC 27551) TaxID=336203 RepID=A0ABQ1F3A0_SPHSA|nr:hypothetical protein GCM10019071_30590 [Sphingobium fuliginis]